MRGLIATLVILLGLGSADAAMLRATWQHTSRNTCGFVLDRQAANQADVTRIWVNAGVNTYLDTGLISGLSYCYTVRAFNAGGESDPSNRACLVATATDPAPPVTTQKEPPPIAPCPRILINP